VNNTIGTTDISASTEGEIVIRQVSRKSQLETLLVAITPDNLHQEADWGQPIGKEAW